MFRVLALALGQDMVVPVDIKVVALALGQGHVLDLEMVEVIDMGAEAVVDVEIILQRDGKLYFCLFSSFISACFYSSWIL